MAASSELRTVPSDVADVDLSEDLLEKTGDLPFGWEGDDDDDNHTIMVSVKDLQGLSGLEAPHGSSPLGAPLIAYETSQLPSAPPISIPNLEDEDEDEVATIMQPPPTKTVAVPASPSIAASSPRLLSHSNSKVGLGPAPFAIGAIIAGALWLILGGT